MSSPAPGYAVGPDSNPIPGGSMHLQLHLCKGPLLCPVQCTEDLRECDVVLGCDFSGATRSRIMMSIHVQHHPPPVLFFTA